MKKIELGPIILTELNIKIQFSELVRKIKTATARPDIRAAAEKILTDLSNLWKPVIVYSWHPYTKSKGSEEALTIYTDKGQIELNLGHSTQFIAKASYVLIAAYSAGKEIEEAGQQAIKDEQLLAAYFIDLIGLLVLEKTGDIVKQLAELKAKDYGWGVSPFLSPGSIHGWALEEQLKLCSLLPLNKIGLTIESDAVLMPFKSLSCLIGIGPSFTSTSVGSACQVCLKYGDCLMKQL
ncbi:MAG: hypothetical protein WBB19_00960 [Desulforhopalus sp.]